MPEKPPNWADWLLTAWVLAVGVFYFGGYFLPDQIGRYTASASALYALMLLISAGTLAFRYLRRADSKTDAQEPTDTAYRAEPKKIRAKNRK